MSGVGTMPVKFARYHTEPKAGGAGAAVVYLLELSVKSGAKSVHVFHHQCSAEPSLACLRLGLCRIWLLNHYPALGFP